MLPSFVSNLIWGEESQNAAKQQQGLSVEPEFVHTVNEEQDEWMIIECGTEPTGKILQLE